MGKSRKKNAKTGKTGDGLGKQIYKEHMARKIQSSNATNAAENDSDGDGEYMSFDKNTKKNDKADDEDEFLNLDGVEESDSDESSDSSDGEDDDGDHSEDNVDDDIATKHIKRAKQSNSDSDSNSDSNSNSNSNSNSDSDSDSSEVKQASKKKSVSDVFIKFFFV